MDIRLRSTSTWLQLASVLVGAWVMIAPAALDFDGAARTNGYIVGPLALTFAFVAVWEIVRGLRLINVPLGAWLVLAPWLLGYDDTAAIVSDRLAGAALIVLPLLASETQARFGGGWRALLRTDDDTLRRGTGKP